MGGIEVDGVSIPLVGGRGGDAVVGRLADVRRLGFGVGDACEPAGCGHRDALLVDFLLQVGRVVEQLAAVLDPVARAVEKCGGAVDSLGVGFDDDLYLGCFLDGRKVGAGGVFGEADRCGFEVVGGDDAGRDAFPTKSADGCEAVSAGDEFKAVAARSHGDGVQESLVGDLVGEFGDGVEVDFEAAVVRVVDGDAVKENPTG